MSKAYINPRDPRRAYYSWFIVTRKPVNGDILMVWAPNVASETSTRKASVPLHPVDRKSAIIDDAILDNLNYSCSLRYNSSLENDRKSENAGDFLSGTEENYKIYPPLQNPTASRGQFEGIENPLLAFTTFAREGLLRIQGLPVDIYSPKFGLLRNYVLIGYTDMRDIRSSAEIQLQFVERRVSSAETLIVDTLAIKQQSVVRGKGPPTEEVDDTETPEGTEDETKETVLKSLFKRGRQWVRATFGATT